MSVSACSLKTNLQSSLTSSSSTSIGSGITTIATTMNNASSGSGGGISHTNKNTSNSFAFPSSNTHLSCTSPTSNYTSYPGVDSTNPNMYDIDTHFRNSNHEHAPAQQQQPRDSLPSPHLLLHSANNPISPNSRTNRTSTMYSQPSTTTTPMEYAVTSRDQATMDVKPSIYSGYSHYSRSAYDYHRPGGLGSPCYDSMHEPNSFNSDRSQYASMQDGSNFANWPMSSVGMPIKTEPRTDFVAETTHPQHASCTEEFSIHSSMRNHDPGMTNGILFPNRSQQTSKHFNHSDMLSGSIHLNGCSVDPNVGGFHSTSLMPTNRDSSSLNGPQPCRNNLEPRGRIPNPTKLVSKTVGRPSRVASTASQPLSMGATSPLGSTTTMTPDSSTTGFTGNRFTCSSDDGETSPAPTCSSGCPQTPGRSRKPAPTLATGRRNLKGELVDPDEADRRMKRRERNRKSAQKCRERKVQRTHELQSQVECLQVEASRLMQELESWRTQARQCVALLQHHCPGVAIPYLSCLNEFCPSLKDSVDSLMDILPADTGNGYLNGPPAALNWKAKPLAKPFISTQVTEMTNGSRFGSANNAPTTNESTTILPSMNMIHSQTTPNRSKSLFGFPTSTANQEKDPLGECLVPSERDTPYPTNIEREEAAMMRSNSSVSIRLNSTGTAMAVGVPAGGVGTAAGTASVGGPASASSSSSCSTYELSLPMIENSLSNLTDNGLFSDPGRNRVRMLSGHDSLSNPNNGNVSASKPPPVLLPETQTTWPAQSYDDYSAKSIQTNTSKQRMFTHSFDSELTVRCDSQTLSSSRSPNSMEGTCYT